MKRNAKPCSRHLLPGLSIVLLILILCACVGTGSTKGITEAGSAQSNIEAGRWTWVSGDSKTNRRGVYGTRGVADAANKPGARTGAVSWIDGEDNLWLFGGRGFASARISRHLNDLWKYDGASWTWVSGDDTGSERGSYGTRGVASGTNMPGGRTGAVSWIDAQGNLWLFGGEGYVGSGFLGHLSDLWKFDGTNWTWVSGGNRIDQEGVYGTQGAADSANRPGARSDAVSWIGPQGNLWFFGGYGYDRHGAEGYLNDLWKFDGTNWTWVSGDSTRYETGNYGTRNVAAAGNKPGARGGAVGWTRSDGSFGLFGGHGNANIGWKNIDIMKQDDRRSTGAGHLNDLWTYDGTNWTWVSGDSKAFYNPEVDFGNTPTPAARFGGVGWIGRNGEMWLFGGSARLRYTGVANDLWTFDGTNWHRVSAGSERKERLGDYGTKGVAAGTNMPPARSRAVGWTDSEGNLWLFGGRKTPGKSSFECFNDLWKYEP